MDSRKYKIIHGSVIKSVFPLNSELEYVWSKKDNSINLILELKSKLIFVNNKKNNIDDFTFFKSIIDTKESRCDDIYIEIYKYCNNNYALEFKGKLKLISGNWDLDRCTVSLEILGNNIYDCINANKKNSEYPLAKFTFKNQITGCPNDLGIYGYDTGSSSYYFLDLETLEAPTYPTLVKKTLLTGVNKDYGYGTFYNLCRNVVSELLVNCGRNINLEMLRSDFFDWNAKGDTTGYIPSTIPKLTTGSVIPSGTKKEWFLPKTPGINYVTGQTNRLTHLLFVPKSNARNTSSTFWETGVDSNGLVGQNRMTFEDIEKIWSTMFQAYWFIDTDGAMRVEHISWFENYTTTYNSTTLDNINFNTANNKFDFNIEKMYEQEIFKFGYNGEFFNGREDLANDVNKLKYSGICINLDSTINYSLDKVDTDMFILNSAGTATFDNYSNDGIFLCSLGYYSSETYSCTTSGYNVNKANAYMHYNVVAIGAIPYVNFGFYFNAHLQWYFLFRSFLSHNRVLSTAKNGPYNITLNSKIRKNKTQDNIKLKKCCNDTFDFTNSRVITELGIGDIQEVKYNTKTGLIKIKALHD